MFTRITHKLMHSRANKKYMRWCYRNKQSFIPLLLGIPIGFVGIEAINAINGESEVGTLPLGLLAMFFMLSALSVKLSALLYRDINSSNGDA